MALGALAILITVMVLVSGLGIVFLYILKNQKMKDRLLYFLGIWAMGIAYMNVTSLPSNYLGEQLVGWSFGFLAVAAMIIKIMKPEKTKIAQILVTVSIIGSMIDIISF